MINPSSKLHENCSSVPLASKAAAVSVVKGEVNRKFAKNSPIHSMTEVEKLATLTSTNPDLALARMLNVGRSSKSWSYWALKRLFDIVFSVSMMLLLSPVFLLAAILIKRESSGPLFFTQERVGERMRVFKIYKFRTMFHNLPSDAHDFYENERLTKSRHEIEDDLRITSFGGFLRKWSLDEIPQFYNILKGDMSLIGPRPLSLSESLSSEEKGLLRYSVPAGLTGLAQIRARGTTASAKRFADDISYIDALGLKQETSIFFSTFRSLRNDY